MTRHWLVTGGAGFIGRHLVAALVARGDAVTVVDIDAARWSPGPGVNHLRRDIRDIDALCAAMAGIDGVFHLAANADVHECISDWAGAHETNCVGTMNVFRAAQTRGSVPVVYASSAAVYGDRSRAICHEGLPERPISPYGADKVACEHQARAFWRIHRLPSAGLRLFNVYGTGQEPASPYASVLVRFAENSRLGRRNTIFGDGKQTRDFIHVDDVVRAFVAAMGQLKHAPDVWVSNVCTGHATSLLEAIQLIDEHYGSTAQDPVFLPVRRGDIRHSRGCPDQMHRLLGLHPAIPLFDGLARSFEKMPMPRQAV